VGDTVVRRIPGGELVFEENTPRGNVVSISLPKAAEPPSGDE